MVPGKSELEIDEHTQSSTMTYNSNHHSPPGISDMITTEYVAKIMRSVERDTSEEDTSDCESYN